MDCGVVEEEDLTVMVGIYEIRKGLLEEGKGRQVSMRYLYRIWEGTGN